MAIQIKNGFYFAINPAGKRVKLTRDSGAIDWLPDNAELSLIKRGAAEYVGAVNQTAISINGEKASQSVGTASVTPDPRMKLPAKQLDDICGELGIDGSKLRMKADKIAAIDTALAAKESSSDISEDQILEWAAELDIDCSAYDGNPNGLRAAVMSARAGLHP